jgi:hypothetical protein
MKSELQQKYELLSRQYQTFCRKQKKQLQLISLFRLISFLGIIPTFYYLYPASFVLAITTSGVLLAIFLFLVRKSVSAGKQLTFFERLTKINEDEIKGLNRDLSPFDPGNEFIDPHHDYSYDLDLYGANSFFQYLNRTATRRGKHQLSHILNNSCLSAEEIQERQTAIGELASELDWRQEFIAKGKATESNETTDDSSKQPIHLKSVVLIRYLIALLPALTLLLILLSATGTTEKHFYLIPIFIQWIIFLIYNPTISKFQKQFDRQAKLLDKYADLLLMIEKKSFRSKFLIELQSRLKNQNKSASKITFELHKILNEFDYRQNLIVGFVLNSVFLWDIRCIYKLYNWQQKYSSSLPDWLEVIAKFDALISLANLNYNHPDWCTPQPIQENFRLHTDQLGHPLIDDSKSVRNSFHLTGEQQIAIITGANMAGKSTFLRTIGINLVLASSGCKVCADSFQFSPVRVYTNMRTSDNLMNDESYFYAELLRLQTMLQMIRNGENLFVIIDEMLKGTNSVDKLNGSKELIRQLIMLKTHGIVATHDLKLTELVQSFPRQIKNLCFEVQLSAEELVFDYKLANGVTQTMNATFLMKKMGIISNS